VWEPSETETTYSRDRSKFKARFLFRAILGLCLGLGMGFVLSGLKIGLNAFFGRRVTCRPYLAAGHNLGYSLV